MSSVVDTKLFTERLLEKALEERDRILEEARARADAIRREAAQKAERAITSELSVRLARERSRILGLALLERRRQLSRLRSELVEYIAKEAWSRIEKVISESEEYYNMFYRLLREACEQLEEQEVIVVANERDLEWLSKNLSRIEAKLTEDLAVPIRLKISEQPIDIKGGVVVFSADRKKYYVNTIEGRFNLAIKKLRRNIATTLKEWLKNAGIER